MFCGEEVPGFISGGRVMILRKAQLVRQLAAFLLVGFVCLFTVSCTEEHPLKIGFVGGLTGRVADLGVAGRDGVLIAVEEKNLSGGIAGRKVELLVKDDQQDAGRAKQIIQEFTEAKVQAILGPMTSSMAVVVQPLINAAQIVTISPTVKTDQLSGIDDYFLRVTTPLSKNAEKIAVHATQQLGLKRFVVALDVSNRAFTETWFKIFRAALIEEGGQIAGVEEFDSQADVHFLPIAERLLKAAPEGVLLLSSAIDTALLAQQIRKLGDKVPLFSSEWASTTDLLSFGGRAVDGMISFHSFNANSLEPVFLSFKAKFINRFGYAPAFASVLGYDAASYLFAGLEKTSSRGSLKESLLKLGTFPGLQSTVKVDQYGDVERKLFLTVIADAQFKVVD
jgi:branched-chain amino acid transport system substrate-binding protein